MMSSAIPYAGVLTLGAPSQAPDVSTVRLALVQMTIDHRRRERP